MKKANGFFAVILWSVLFQAWSLPAVADKSVDIEVKLEKSYILGLWNFLDSLAELKSPNKAVSEVFNQSKWSNPKLRDELQITKETIQKNFSKRYFFTDFPENRDEMSWDLYQHAYYQAAKSMSIEDFESRLGQTMPASDLRNLVALLKSLEPAYKDLIWNREQKSLDRTIVKLNKRLKMSGFVDWFSKAKMFYRSTVPVPFKLKFAVYPIPSVKGNTRATVIYDTALVQVLRDEADIDGRLGVFFHEICHSLYESQPLVIQNELHQFLTEDQTFWGQMAYRLFNEGLATAIGNGWFYHKLTGQMDESEWYNDAEINAFAKAIYPMVYEYLEKSKSIDRSFVKASIEKLKQIFPHGPKSFKLRLSSLYVVGANLGDIKLSTLKPVLREKLENLRDLSMSSPVDHVKTFENIASMPLASSFMMIIGPDKKESYKAFNSKFPDVTKGFTVSNKLGRWVWYDGSDAERLRIFAKVNSAEDFTSLVEFILKEDAFKRPREYLSF